MYVLETVDARFLIISGNYFSSFLEIRFAPALNAVKLRIARGFPHSRLTCSVISGIRVYLSKTKVYCNLPKICHRSILGFFLNKYISLLCDYMHQEGCHMTPMFIRPDTSCITAIFILVFLSCGRRSANFIIDWHSYIP